MYSIISIMLLYHLTFQMQSMTKRGLRLFYSEDEGDSSDDGNKMALATVSLYYFQC